MKRARPIAFLLVGFSLTLLGAVVAGSSTASAQEPVQRNKAGRNPPELIEADMVTRRAVCRWAAEPPVLDGKLDDRCWQKGPSSSLRFVLDKNAETGNLPTSFGTTMHFTPRRLDARRRATLVWNQAERYSLGREMSSDAQTQCVIPDSRVSGQSHGRVQMAFPRRGRPRVQVRAPGQRPRCLTGTLDQPGDRDLGWSVEVGSHWSASQPAEKPAQATSGSSHFADMIMGRTELDRSS